MSTRLLYRLLLLLTLFVLRTTVVYAQAPAITYQRYDTAITLRADGTFLVREIQQIRFDDEFHTAFADIPTAMTRDIQNIQIYEGDTPYTAGGSGPNTFTTERDGDFIYVNWEYTPTQPGDVRTFILEYAVVGGLWVYSDQTVLEWRAVPADRSDIVVESSVVTITLPAAVATDQLQYTAYGPTFQAATSANTVTFTATEPLPSGVQFQVQVGVPSTLVAAERQPWQEQEDTARLAYRFKELNVALTLEPDGTLWVDEYHHLAVEAGTLDQGSRRIPLAYVDAIDQIKLSEGEEPFVEANNNCTYCLQISTTPRAADWVYYDESQRTVVTDEARAGAVQLNWQFPPLVRGEETTLRLRYRVLGAVRHLANQQEVQWSAVFPEHDQPIEAAKVRLTLPPGLDRNAVKLRGGTVEWLDEQRVLLTKDGVVAPGQLWSIGVTLPPTATTSAAPQWEADVAAAAVVAGQAATRHARLQLAFGVAALMILLVGLLCVYLIWYLWGRDRPLPAIADYLTEPPSNLPPAIVAYLIDEEPSTKGALASLFHLANLGVLWIRFGDELALQRVEGKKLVAGETLTAPTGETVSLPRHLVTLFTALEPALPAQQEQPLHAIYTPFQAILPRVYADMGDEATRFFDELPAEARHRWLVRGQWLILLGLVGGVILELRYFAEFGWLPIAPAIAAVAAGLALVFVSQWMPRRTTAGVEEAQKWLAFRTYLKNLKQYGNVAEAQRILDRYFAYAVALDVEEVVLEQAANLGSVLPEWSYTPTWQPRRRPILRREQPSGGGQSSPLPPLNLPPSTDASTPTGASQERPSLRGTSAQLGQALSNASNNLGSLLRTAAGDSGKETPFDQVQQGTQTAGEIGAKVASTTLEILGDILKEAASGGGGGGYSSSGSSHSSWSSSRSHSSSSSGGFSAGRSSAERRSGGGGSRGFR